VTYAARFARQYPAFIHVSDGKMHESISCCRSPVRSTSWIVASPVQGSPDRQDAGVHQQQLHVTRVDHHLALSLSLAIELFFKGIKQHLRIKAFFGTSENTVKT